MDPRKKELVRVLNKSAEEYEEKEKVFRENGCRDEDRLHMETVRNFWQMCMTAFRDSSKSAAYNPQNPCISQKMQFKKKVLKRTFDFECDKCGKKLTGTNQTNVSRHIESHNKIKKEVNKRKLENQKEKVFDYKCQTCGLKLLQTNKNNVMKHLEKHQKKLNKKDNESYKTHDFECPICEKKFIEMNEYNINKNLEKHQKQIGNNID